MKRRLFNVLATVSLVITVAVAVVWAKSYSGLVRFDIGGALGYGPIVISHGRLLLDNRRSVLWLTQQNESAQSVYQQLTSMGKIAPLPRIQKINHYHVWISMWLVTSIPSTATLCLSLCSAFSKKRSLEGVCHTCGYDLRATPNQCPECGAMPKRNSTDR